VLDYHGASQRFVSDAFSGRIIGSSRESRDVGLARGISNATDIRTDRDPVRECRKMGSGYVELRSRVRSRSRAGSVRGSERGSWEGGENSGKMGRMRGRSARRRGSDADYDADDDAERYRKDTGGETPTRSGANRRRRLLYQPEARVHRRALSPDQGRRYHSDIRRIYILHERPPASSESRTIGPVERLGRRTHGGCKTHAIRGAARSRGEARFGGDRSQGIDRLRAAVTRLGRA